MRLVKDINAVLAQKLEELKRCRIDLYCLKGTIRLLEEPTDHEQAVDSEQENVL